MGIFGEWNERRGLHPERRADLHYDTAPIPAINAGQVRRRRSSTATRSSSRPARTIAAAAAKFGMYLMTDDPSRTMGIQNASVPQLRVLLTDPALTAIPHFQSVPRHRQPSRTPGPPR